MATCTTVSIYTHPIASTSITHHSSTNSTIILNNWVINPTGHPNSHVELDLVQEHLIFWIKVSSIIIQVMCFVYSPIAYKTIYKAHGSNASWESLADISPCVDFLRRLAREFNKALGDDQGVRHAPVDLSKSIDTLMRSFAANEVHSIKPGRRRADGDGAPVVDVMSEGARQLVQGANSPMAQFNRALRRMQQRRRLTPVTGPSTEALDERRTVEEES